MQAFERTSDHDEERPGARAGGRGNARAGERAAGRAGLRAETRFRGSVDSREGSTGPLVFVKRAWFRAEACLVLSSLFGYPDQSRAEALASPPFLERCRNIASLAQLTLDEDLHDEARLGGYVPSDAAAPAFPAPPRHSPGHLLRAECTRLFWTYPRLVKIEGRRWVKASERDERNRVLQLYRELGLRNKPGVNVPPDDLASELDYAAYVLRAEALAWDGNDSLSALDWNELFERFLEQHLRPMALGVSQAILAQTKLDAMRFYARLLKAVALGKR